VEQRRLLLAFALSLGLLWVYQQFVLRKYPQHPGPSSPLAEQGQPAPTTSPSAAAPAPVPPAFQAAVDTGEPVVVETDVLRATLTTAGARLQSLELKGYQRTVAKDSPPLDLVQAAAVLPLTVALGDKSDAAVVYKPSVRELEVHDGNAGDVVFSGDADGRHIEKRFHFSGDGYLFDVTAAVTGPGTPGAVGMLLTPLPLDTAGGGRTPGRENAIGFTPPKLVEKAATDLAKQTLTFDGATWGGFAAQYFMTVAMPADGTGRVVMGVAGDLPIVRVDVPVQDGQSRFVVFAGPKDRNMLMSTGHDLVRAIDFGWFWFIAIPLLSALRVLHAALGNYGLAIIALTALVKLATAPLTQTTFRNMREMQKIQPQMAKLRERYKDDAQALNKEMMELYRRHRVNPFMGCLPMFLQLPIFVGLYNALLHSIELRHAPFVLWINDLSAPDRLMVAGFGIPVLTLFMGASMFLQQWLTPQQGDPTQQRMMMFMPLVFTVTFLNFPAGLVLYWLVNNVLTIGQQYLNLRSAP